LADLGALFFYWTFYRPAAGRRQFYFQHLGLRPTKKASKTPEDFGQGTPPGLIASESSNNATAGGALIMMMALGIPGDAVTAVMLGALTIHNIAPSPTFISTQPVLAYGIMVAYFLANFMTLIMTSGALRIFLLVTRVPLYILGVVILLYCAIGVFTLNNTSFDIWTLLVFGIIGFAMVKNGFPLTPMVLGVVLGPLAELNLSRSLSTSDDLTLFFHAAMGTVLHCDGIVFCLFSRSTNQRPKPVNGGPSFMAWALWFAPPCR
jgi:Uncharacterized protein conserved in bacteria